MSTNPTTFQGEPADLVFDWNDPAELQKREDSGTLHSFRTLRRAPLIDLVAYVNALPEGSQDAYAILKSGDQRFEVGTIRALARRADYPGRASRTGIRSGGGAQ